MACIEFPNSAPRYRQFGAGQAPGLPEIQAPFQCASCSPLSWSATPGLSHDMGLSDEQTVQLLAQLQGNDHEAVDFHEYI